jgi:hypothetical protein
MGVISPQLRVCVGAFRVARGGHARRIAARQCAAGAAAGAAGARHANAADQFETAAAAAATAASAARDSSAARARRPRAALVRDDAPTRILDNL